MLLFNGAVLIVLQVTCGDNRGVVSGLWQGGCWAGTWNWFPGRRII